MRVKVTVESIVNPTEDESKVERALHNIFPSATIEKTNSPDDRMKLKVQGNGLEFLATLRNSIKQERIRAAARSILLSRTSGDRTRFYLNKQVAVVGRVSFCEPVGESPLGPISIEIESDDPQVVIDYLAAKPGEGAFPRLVERRRR